MEEPPIPDVSDDEQDGEPMVIREQDRFLPIANIMRIMRKILPKNAKISKEAKECVQECVSEFISFITSEASERCKKEKRKTINADDIINAMTSLGFDNYIDPMRIYITKYRDHQFSSKRSTSKRDDDRDSEGEAPLAPAAYPMYNPFVGMVGLPGVAALSSVAGMHGILGLGGTPTPGVVSTQGIPGASTGSSGGSAGSGGSGGSGRSGVSGSLGGSGGAASALGLGGVPTGATEVPYYLPTQNHPYLPVFPPQLMSAIMPGFSPHALAFAQSMMAQAQPQLAAALQANPQFLFQRAAQAPQSQDNTPPEEQNSNSNRNE